MIHEIAKEITDAFSAHGFPREVHPEEIKSWTGSELAHARSWASAPAWEEPVPVRVQQLVGELIPLQYCDGDFLDAGLFDARDVARLRLLGAHFCNGGRNAYSIDEMKEGSWAPELSGAKGLSSFVSWETKPTPPRASPIQSIPTVKETAQDLSPKLDAMMGPKLATQKQNIIIASTPSSTDDDFISKNMASESSSDGGWVATGIPQLGNTQHVKKSVQEWVEGARTKWMSGSAAGAREVAVVALSSLGAYDDATGAALREAERKGFPHVAAVLTTRFRDLVAQLRYDDEMLDPVSSLPCPECEGDMFKHDGQWKCPASDCTFQPPPRCGNRHPFRDLRCTRDHGHSDGCSAHNGKSYDIWHDYGAHRYSKSGHNKSHPFNVKAPPNNYMVVAKEPQWRQGCGPLFDAEIRAMEESGAEIRYDEDRDWCAPFDRQTGVPVEWQTGVPVKWLPVGSKGDARHFYDLMDSIAIERKALADAWANRVREHLLSIPLERVESAIENILAAIEE